MRNTQSHKTGYKFLHKMIKIHISVYTFLIAVLDICYSNKMHAQVTRYAKGYVPPGVENEYGWIVKVPQTFHFVLFHSLRINLINLTEIGIGL